MSGAERTTARPEIRALTGVRIVAALWVVVYHMQPDLAALLPGLERGLRPVLQAGYLGVDLFFTLSGFILAYTYVDRFGAGRPEQVRRFLWLRLSRIYPVHLMTLMAMLALVLAAKVTGTQMDSPEQLTASGFVRNVLMLQAAGVSASANAHLTWNTPAWSISAELFAYALFPALAVVVVRVRRPRSALLGAAASMAAMLLLLGAIGERTSGGALLRVVGEFVAGMLLHQVYRAGAGSRRWWTAALPVMGVAVVATVLISDASLFWCAPLLAASVLVVARAGGPLGRALASRPAVYWGRVSFSLYMTHVVSLIVLRQVVPPDSLPQSSVFVRVGVLLAYLVVIAAAAVATYVVVERPAQAWLRRRGPGRGRQDSTGAAVPAQARPAGLPDRTRG